jgi:UDP-N-acetylglucosamine diphosphorylase/glucosamine-1-phosphate N-acetyltransferase
MAAFEEADAARAADGRLNAGSIIVNARFVPGLQFEVDDARRSAAVWRCAGRVVALRLRNDLQSGDFEDGSIALDDLPAAAGDQQDIPGWWHEEVWDFIRLLPDELRSDVESIAARADLNSTVARPPAHATVIGDAPIVLLGDSERPTIEPHVVLDASNGPIVVERGAVVHAFTRLIGPCYVGPQTTVMGGDISVCSIGPVCKVRGEMSNTVMLAYANKGHDGFIGHSYIGRWVNIGASTVTSNLKNTYGSVSLWTPQGLRDTGMQFLGTMFGDHVKTGIGLRLTTGTVLAAGANVYDGMPPKAVPPFSWGSGPPYSLYRIDKFIETAERMMARRHVSLSDRARRHWSAVHVNRWSLEIGDDVPSGT